MEAFVAATLNDGAAKRPELQEKPKGRGNPNPHLNDIPPEARRERARKAGLASAAKRAAMGLPMSFPAGWTLDHVIIANQLDQQETKRILDIMAAEGVLPDDANAAEAMGAVVKIMRSTQSNEMKLKAARTVLEYTKSKPSAKVDHTIRTAEDFLDDLAAKEGDSEE